MYGMVHPTDEMTSRQRLLAAYHGRQVDRLPYWVKLGRLTWRDAEPRGAKNWSYREKLDYIHADGLFYVGHGARVVRPRVQIDTERSDSEIVKVTHTPDGDLHERWGIDPYTRTEHPTVFPVKTREDIHTWRWVHADVTVTTDAAEVDKARQAAAEIGQRGIGLCAWGASPLMDLIQYIIGPVNTHLFLHDYPEQMDELIELMHAANLQVARAVARTTPADVVVSVENTSTRLTSPGQFRRYNHRHLCDYGRAIEGEGKMHELHQCGHLLAVLDDIDTIPAASTEAFTTPTLGNTHLADGKTRAPSKTLVGGTSANTWLRPVAEIREHILAELDACLDHRRIVLTTAGVAPPACPAEVYRQIGQWIPTVPIRM